MIVPLLSGARGDRQSKVVSLTPVGKVALLMT